MGGSSVVRSTRSASRNSAVSFGGCAAKASFIKSGTGRSGLMRSWFPVSGSMFRRFRTCLLISTWVARPRATLVKMTRWPARLLSGAITKLFFEVSTSSSGPARLKYAVSEPFISEMMRMLSSGPYSPIRPSQRGGAGAGLGDCASEADCQYEAARVDCLLAKGLIAAPQANKPTASFNNIEGYFSSRIFMIGYAYAKLDHGGPRE